MVLIISSFLSKMIALNVMKFEEGRISINDRTVVMMPVDVLLRLLDLTAEAVGDERASDILYELGRYQTLTGSGKYLDGKKQLRRFFNTVPMTGDPALEMGREVLKHTGWGDTRIVEISSNCSVT